MAASQTAAIGRHQAAAVNSRRGGQPRHQPKAALTAATSDTGATAIATAAIAAN
jgi:hypothetical protein